MTRRTVLFTIAMLMSFMSTQVVHTAGAEPSFAAASTPKPKAHGKSKKRSARRARKHKPAPTAHASTLRA